MKTPRLSAEYAIGPALGAYTGHGAVTGHHSARLTGAVMPQVTSSCLASCVGPSAADVCSIQCGPDLACWKNCAGVTDTTCVAACYAT